MRVCLKCDHIFSSKEWECPACGYKPVRMNGVDAHAPDFANSGGGFKSEYFAELARLEAANFWFRARNALLLWALRTYKHDARNFLEVGCGTGFVLSGISKAHPAMELSGSEIFLAGLPHAAARVPDANFMQMDARHIPFKDEFDAIGSFDVLEHIEEDEVVLLQLYRALKPGGILLITVPQHPWLWSTADEYACHVRRYTESEIEKKIQGAGFEIVRSTSFVTALLPAMLVSRALQRRRKTKFVPASELKINSVLNKIFESLMNLDILGIKAGLSLPIGGSRLIVSIKK